MKSKSLKILVTCFNRRTSTLSFFESVTRQMKQEKGYKYEIVVLDDNSPDGTARAIKDKFPEVTVLDGTGELYWGGGMRACYDEISAKLQSQNTYLLVCNDDVSLDYNAIKRFLNFFEEIIGKRGEHKETCLVGSCYDDEGNHTYGGAKLSKGLVPYFQSITPSHNNEFIECDTVNMNFCLLNTPACISTGFIDQIFTHGKGDFDFGLRLNKSGQNCFIAPDYYGKCSRNGNKNTSKDKHLNFLARWERLISVKEEPFFERCTFGFRHFGLKSLVWIPLPYISFFLNAISRTNREGDIDNG